jgi:hypothetical protein
VQRECDLCGVIYEAQRRTSRFHDPNCRVAWSRGARPPAREAEAEEKPRMDSTDVASRVERELAELRVADRYEAGIVVGIARQLDSGVVHGTAYVSLSKEVDRRMDALRLLAERPDDPVAKVEAQLHAHRLHLVEGGGA